MAQVAELEARLIADITDFDRKMNSASSSLNRVDNAAVSTTRGMGGLSNMMKAGIATAFSVGAIRSISRFATEMETLSTRAQSTRRQFDTVFEGMTETMELWVDSQNEAFGVSEIGLQQMAANVQDLLVPMGFLRNEAADMTKTILTTANALSEWTGGAVDAEDAANRIRRALLGERESLEALNIKVSEAMVQSELLATGMDGLTGAAGEQAKAQATLAIVIRQAADALTAYEQREGTAIERTKELTAASEDAQVTLSEALRPEIEHVKGQMVGMAQAAASAADWLARLRGAEDDAAAGTRSLIAEFEQLMDLLTGRRFNQAIGNTVAGFFGLGGGGGSATRPLASSPIETPFSDISAGTQPAGGGSTWNVNITMTDDINVGAARERAQRLADELQRYDEGRGFD